MLTASGPRYSTAQVSDFIADSVRARGLAPKTANRYREIMNRIFNWAIKGERVRIASDRNPAARVERYREPAPDISFLTLPQIDEQLDALRESPQLQTMVATLIYAGLRRSELLWLTTADVDLHAGQCGVIRVQAKTVNGEFWQPKTKRNRAVPISPDLAAYLIRHRPRPSDGDWYFPSPLGRLWDPDNFDRRLRAGNKRAGLSWTSLHYRHTFASLLAQNNQSLYTIAKLMGNSAQICEQHYAAFAPEALADSVQFRRTGSRRNGDQPLRSKEVQPA